MKQLFFKEINRVAETHFYIRPVLLEALKNQKLTEVGHKTFGNFTNYFDYWEATKGITFFDMTTLVRLGSVIENCLKYYYMEKKAYSSIDELVHDPLYSPNIFQKLHSDKKKIFKNGINLDLSSNSFYKDMNEIMQHRHLYAHNLGLLDEKYINNINLITGYDIREHPDVKGKYPKEDVYWFKPLIKIGDYIEKTRSFFREYQ